MYLFVILSTNEGSMPLTYSASLVNSLDDEPAEMSQCYHSTHLQEGACGLQRTHHTHTDTHIRYTDAGAWPKENPQHTRYSAPLL